VIRCPTTGRPIPIHIPNWASYGPYYHQITCSDAEISADIKNWMLYDPWVESTQVDVTVHDGVVTLTGNVPFIFEKRAAGDDAWDTPGVVDVHNDLITTP
jgi:osmotically-inducible protein OsmY